MIKIKKIYLITFLILLSITVAAIGLNNRNTNLTVSARDVTTLKTKFNAPNVNIQFDDMGCDTEYCYFLAYTPNSKILNRVHGNTLSIPRYYVNENNETVEHTDNEIVTLRDAKGQARLANIANATRQRDIDARTFKNLGGLATVR